MTIVRIGNNIHVLWKFYNNNGSKYALSGKVRKVYLRSAGLEKEIETIGIQYRNELTFMVDAHDLTRYGAYKLVVKIRESESQTEDATYEVTGVFQIVSKSYPNACNAIDGEVDVVFTSVLNNVVVERIEGLSAYEIAVNEGFVGTEQDWLDSLVGPPGPPGGPSDLPENLVYLGRNEGGTDVEVVDGVILDDVVEHNIIIP